MKGILRSKTFWYNVISIIIYILQHLFNGVVIPDNVHVILDGLINILLRVQTTTAVSIAEPLKKESL